MGEPQKTQVGETNQLESPCSVMTQIMADGVARVFLEKWTDVSVCDSSSAAATDSVPCAGCITRQALTVYVGGSFDHLPSPTTPSTSQQRMDEPPNSYDTNDMRGSAIISGGTSRDSTQEAHQLPSSVEGCQMLRELRERRQLGVTAANRLDQETSGLETSVNNAQRISRIYKDLTPKMHRASRNLGTLFL
jgi:hypothetical protein